MTRFVRMVPLVVLVGLVGCHLTGGKGDGLPGELEPGRGRVDRTYVGGLGPSIRATLAALDELEVRPDNGIIRANDSASVLGKQKWVGQTNAEYLPDDASFHDLFDRQRLNVENSEPLPFAPILLAYKGETKAGKPVVVIVRSIPPDAVKTEVMARVGRDGDEVWGREFLAKIAAHLPQPPPPVPPADLPPLPGE